MSLEKPFAAALRKEIARTTKQAAREIRHTHDVGGAINGHKHALRAIFVRHYRVISRAFFNRAIDAMGKSMRVRERKAPPTLTPVLVAEPASTDDAYATLWDSLQAQIATQVDDISDTTREQIQQRVADGVSNGDSWDDIAASIEDLGIDSYRADVIARTEAHSVSNASTLDAADSLGLALTKEWAATEDDRTRPDHAEADGQEAEMDGTFIVGGAEMQYPGDPDGPPEQVINCRCVMLFNEKEG